MNNGVKDQIDEAAECPFDHDQLMIEAVTASTSENHKKQHQPKFTSEEKRFTLRNYQTGETLDIKNPSSASYQDCRHHVCTSTLMTLAPHAHQSVQANADAIDEIEILSADYVEREAHDYLAMFHRDMKKSSDEFAQRFEQVRREIQTTGKYTHTTEELAYGCQLAWRNSSRCINRLYWKTLKTVDRRHVQTNEEMFREICEHMRFAYNGGSLEASIMVMNPRSRMWSTQYLRYACYELSDGSLMGDPMNQELTKVAMDLGWNKPESERTQWDLLPIIVQVDPNEEPSWYELPEDLKFQVFLSHPDPKYDSVFKSLGLRWVSQPYVSDKALEIGGIFYRCVPFSGWFMQTEIARDLCDVQRYNMIPKLAACLNLDISVASNSKLNLDRLYVEVNASVIYSYEIARVAIVDHHTAAAGFIKFMKAEIKDRGHVPADWVWLVPPISSGMSSLFHQEMLNYVVKPRILDQQNPWIRFRALLKEKQKLLVGQPLTGKVRHRWLILSAARVIIGFAVAAMKRRITVNVLYASLTGTAQSYAQQMATHLLHIGYNPTLMTLDSFPFLEHRDTRSIVLIITSTFGQGNAPDGGLAVEKWLNTLPEPKDAEEKTNDGLVSERTHECSLTWCTYSVCAIGSSAYPFFCGFGKLIDAKFEQLGATRLLPCKTCDALHGQYHSYGEWESSVMKVLRTCYPHAALRPDTESFQNADGSSTHDDWDSETEDSFQCQMSTRPRYIPLEFYNRHRKDPYWTNLDAPISKQNPCVATVLRNVELIGPCNILSDYVDASASSEYDLLPIENNLSDHSVRLIVLETPGLVYDAGDHVCIFPQNASETIDRLIMACNWDPSDPRLDQPCSLAMYTDGKFETIRDILTHYVDIMATPLPYAIDIIATYANDSTEQHRLVGLARRAQLYEDWKINLPTVSDLLQQFPSIHIPLDHLIQLLPKLQPRYYSISSSARFHPDELHITVSVVTYATPTGVIRNGICSTFLKKTIPLQINDATPIDSYANRNVSKVRLFLSPNPQFRLPGQEAGYRKGLLKSISNVANLNDSRGTLLMFAVGSGIAPFRSFWQEIQALQNFNPTYRPNCILFMGCRTASDFLYAQELRSLCDEAQEGQRIFTKVVPVFSRTRAVPKRYVQHVMLDYHELIHSILMEKMSFIYMCGSIRACQGIEASLVTILQSFSTDPDSITMQDAKQIITKMKEDGKIRQDMFG